MRVINGKIRHDKHDPFVAGCGKELTGATQEMKSMLGVGADVLDCDVCQVLAKTAELAIGVLKEARIVAPLGPVLYGDGVHSEGKVHQVRSVKIYTVSDERIHDAKFSTVGRNRLNIKGF